MPDLKPCPFCAGEPEFEYVVGSHVPYIQFVKVMCRTCGCGTKIFPLEDRYGNKLPAGELYAKSAWNRRVPE